jgi:cyanophycinase-like exopeptidase
MILQDSNGKVKILGQMTVAYSTERGLRQGDALSTTLFNIVLEMVKRNIKTTPNGTIFNRMRQYRAYPDKVLILGQLV